MSTKSVHFRINIDEIDKFHRKCEQSYQRPPSDMLREFVTAFNDDRLRIIPSAAQEKERRTLYNEP